MSNVFDFIRARDPRYSNPLFNFLNAGQQRRQNLNNLFGEIGDTLSQFVSPRGRDQIESYEQLHNMLSPIVHGGSSIQNMQQGNYVDAFMDVAGFAIPTAIVAKYGGKTAVDAARYLSESLALTGGGMRDISENVYEQVIARMNQPGEMPVVGSNLGNVGHNQGPPLEIERPVIPEYSPSLKAATELPQEKGTYNQMRSMLLKRGAKEEELEWSAFDKYFRDQDQVFKSDIIDYLEKNAGNNMFQETTKTAKGILDEASFISREDMIDRYVSGIQDEAVEDMMKNRRHAYLEDPAVRQNNYKIFKANELEKDQFENFADHHGFPGVWDDEDQLDNFRTYLYDEFEGPETYVKFEEGLGRPSYFRGLKNKEEALDALMDKDKAEAEVIEELYAYADELDVVDLREQLGLGGIADGESYELPDWAEFFTKGARDYTTKTFAYSDPEGLRYRSPFATKDNSHWPEDDVVVHTRVGQFPLLNESGSVYHVGELQSDFGQDIQKGLKPIKQEIEDYEIKLKNLQDMRDRKMKITDAEGNRIPSYPGSDGLSHSDELYYDGMEKFYKDSIEWNKNHLKDSKGGTKDQVDLLVGRSLGSQRETVLANQAQKALDEEIALKNNKKELLNDMFNHKYSLDNYEGKGLKQSWSSSTPLDQMRDEIDERFSVSRFDALNYLMDENVTTDLAKNFRNKNYSDLDPDLRIGDDTSKTYNDAFNQLKIDMDDAYDKLPVGVRTHSGAPLVNSTNKWVDFALRKELRNAVAAGSDYMTIGNPDMVRRMTGGAEDGQEEFYGKIVPQRLKEILKKFDKDAKVEVVEIQTAADRNIINTRPESKGQWKVLGVKLTDKLVNAMADKGMPIFGYLPGAVGVGGAGVLASQASQENQPSGVLNQF